MKTFEKSAVLTFGKTEFARRRAALKFLSIAFASALGIPSGVSAKDSKSGDGEREDVNFQFEQNAKTTGWLNFTMPDDRHVALNAKLNQIPMAIVLDSGVGVTVVDRSVAATLGLNPQGSFTGAGITGNAQGVAAQGLSVSLGNLTVQTSRTTIFDLTGLSAAMGSPILAIIGRDLLGPLIADIDFPEQRIAFRRDTKDEHIEGFAELPLVQEEHGFRVFPISIDGRHAVNAVFDLGSDTPLYISEKYVADEGLLAGARTSTSLSAGVEGMQINTIGIIKTLSLSGIVLHDVPVEVPKTWKPSAVAFVGLPVLRRFRLIIDFGNSTLKIIPNPKAIREAFRKDRSGIGAIPSNGHLRIIHVAPGSPAAAAGLRVDDEIVAINGHRIDDEYLKSRPREGSKPAGTIFSLTLKGGAEVKLTLEDYF